MTRSEAMEKKWKDPKYREMMKAAMKAAWRRDPERREKARQRMIGNVLSPETIQKISISNRITYELKKELEKEKAFFKYLEGLA
jgi:hypothetical protein